MALGLSVARMHRLAVDHLQMIALRVMSGHILATEEDTVAGKRSNGEEKKDIGDEMKDESASGTDGETEVIRIICSLSIIHPDNGGFASSCT